MRVILITFINGQKAAFSSLKPFYRDYPQYAELKDKIDYRLSRKKEPFICSDFMCERLDVVF
jgi:hypothetical protein